MREKGYSLAMVSLIVIIIHLVSHPSVQASLTITGYMLVAFLFYIVVALLFCGLVGIAVLLVGVILKLMNIAFKRKRF